MCLSLPNVARDGRRYRDLRDREKHASPPLFASLTLVESLFDVLKPSTFAKGPNATQYVPPNRLAQFHLLPRPPHALTMESAILSSLSAAPPLTKKVLVKVIRSTSDCTKKEVKKEIKALIKRNAIAVSSEDLLSLPPKRSKPTPLSVHMNSATLSKEWPYPTDFGDHFETPRQAYKDVKPILKLIKPADDLTIYDPYYCRGQTISHLNATGFPIVINVKQDFYADVAAHTVPSHDVLLTNPPYSGSHKSQIFEFLLTQHHTPFLLLLPAWTAKWLAWRTFLHAMARRLKGKEGTLASAMGKMKKLSNLEDTLERKANVFYVAPREGRQYEFEAAVASRDSAPFFSVWFVGGFKDAEEMGRSVAAITAKGKVRVFLTLAEMIAAGVVVGLEEERAKQLMVEGAKERRDEAIRKLEEERALKGRKRDYEAREKGKFEGEGGDVVRLLALESNGKACRHFFVGSGCVRGDKCRFKHVLKTS